MCISLSLKPKISFDFEKVRLTVQSSTDIRGGGSGLIDKINFYFLPSVNESVAKEF